jgi:2-haloacid dehalogenase
MPAGWCVPGRARAQPVHGRPRSGRAVPASIGAVRAVVFDLGGVLIDWDPRYVFRELLPGREAEMEAFLRDVANQGWNAQMDAGRTWAEGVAALSAEHPGHRHLIETYAARWADMLGGPIEETVAVLAELREAEVPLYVLSNWSAETFPIALARYHFLDWFDGRVISGEVGLIKPDPRIYRHLMERFRLEPTDLFYTDDHEPNIVAARELGITSSLFRGAAQLRAELVDAGFLDGRPAAVHPDQVGG